VTIIDTDVLIVGGGVAGALIAAKLAGPKLRVTILESGSPVVRADAVGKYAASPDKGLHSPYADRDNDTHAPIASLGAFPSNYLRRTGGTTWHWQGHTPRLLPNDFRLRSMYGVGVDWPLTYDDLEPYYVRAEHELGVSGDHDEWNGVLGAHRSEAFPMPRIWPSYADRRFAERLGAFAIDGRDVQVRTIPQARNSQPYQNRPPCAGNSTCIPICPIGAKYDATVHLQIATGRQATLVQRTSARRLVITNGTISGIEAEAWDGSSATYRAKRYVIAAHAIESARLLLASGLGTDRPQLGRNLMDHPTGAMIGLAPERWFTFRGPPATSSIDAWRDGPERSTQAAWKLSLGNDGFGRFPDRTPEAAVRHWMLDGLFGEALRARLVAEVPRWYRIGWATEQLPREENRVTLVNGEIHVDYRVDDYTTTAFATTRAAIARIFERVGMTGVQVSADPRSFGGSGHILGTCRMGRDPATSVVDRDCRVHGIDNLFVVGSSTFPTGGTANPTLTIAALALRAANTLANEVAS
jgi:choline dehydrogenase-like flavoprotein